MLAGLCPLSGHGDQASVQVDAEVRAQLPGASGKGTGLRSRRQRHHLLHVGRPEWRYPRVVGRQHGRLRSNHLDGVDGRHHLPTLGHRDLPAQEHHFGAGAGEVSQCVEVLRRRFVGHRTERPHVDRETSRPVITFGEIVLGTTERVPHHVVERIHGLSLIHI